jgi:peptidoglycan/LPS O-acetylase OafA/YrhL
LSRPAEQGDQESFQPLARQSALVNVNSAPSPKNIYESLRGAKGNMLKKIGEFAQERQSAIVGMAKIYACFAIFIHHYLKTIRSINEYTVSVIVGISIFLFVSGYITAVKNNFSSKWLARRISKIYIPYLIIIIPLILLNVITGHKNVDYNQILIEIIGGSLFVHKPFYEATWFVTFILILYIIVYLSNSISSYKELLMILLLSIFILCMANVQHVYFVKNIYIIYWVIVYFTGFISGKFIFKCISLSEKNAYFDQKNTIATLSKYSLEFYLLHGPVLFFLYNIIKLDKENLFLLSIIFTISLSIFLKKITDFVFPSLSIDKFF